MSSAAYICENCALRFILFCPKIFGFFISSVKLLVLDFWNYLAIVKLAQSHILPIERIISYELQEYEV